MMESFFRAGRIGGLVLILLIALAASAPASAQISLKSLYAFTGGSDGAYPVGGLVADASGNLYGTTAYGGTYGSQNGGYGYGTVFEIVKNHCTSSGCPVKTLVNFNGTDGVNPSGSLIFDANGNLYGTTDEGGAGSDPSSGDWGYGTVFELAKSSSTATGYASTPTTLVSFSGTDGAWPNAGLIFDASGNLYGTTSNGGPGFDFAYYDYQCGTVFEIVNNGTVNAPVYASTPTTLASFNGTDGYGPMDGLIFDASGNLYGTTELGGTYYGSQYLGYGTVFELVKSLCTSSGCPVTTLASFNGTDGAIPWAGLIFDASGNLYGTTQQGGSDFESSGDWGYGTVFEIVNNGTVNAPVYASTPTTLASFDGTDNAYPYAGLIFDASGNLYGTTGGFGVEAPFVSNGTVFEIVNNGTVTAPAYASTPTTLASFDGTDGADPEAGLIFDASGNLYGTATGGGPGSDPANGYFGNGTVFEVTGTDFVPPKVFVGTPGTANCEGVSVSALAQSYGGEAHAAAALGYTSVARLHDAVISYCVE